MRALILNLVLAVAWSSLSGRLSASGLIVGFVFGYFLLWWLRGLLAPTPYFEKVPMVFAFAAFFMKELIHSNLRVARDVLTIRRTSRTGIVAVPLDVTTDFEITLLANLITLTPGTMSLDVSNDRKILYIHAMFVTDPDEIRRSIKTGFERRVLELFR